MWAWRLLREAASAARQLEPGEARRFGVDSDGRLLPTPRSHSVAELHWQHGRWECAADGPASALLDLYLPLCSANSDAPLTLGHLGQSLDGYIATASGDSDFVSDPENIVHMHRLRALFDAVIVGAGTVEADDPQLTVRLAEGGNPLRIVLDPRRRLRASHRIFCDGAAPTLVVAAASPTGTQARDLRSPESPAPESKSPDPHAGARERVGAAEVLRIPGAPGELDLAILLAQLRARGVYSVFVEGGGTTVSRFLQAGLLDRLHVAVAPMLTGRGRPGLRLPPRAAIDDCLRPDARLFAMGRDVLFDCDLRAAPAGPVPPGSGLRRID